MRFTIFVVFIASLLAAGELASAMEMDVTWRDANADAQTSTVPAGQKLLFNHNPYCATPDLVFVIRSTVNAIQTFELTDPDGVVHSHTGQAASWTFTVAPKEGPWRGRCTGSALAIVSVSYLRQLFLEMDVTWRDANADAQTSTVEPDRKVLFNHNPYCTTPDLVFVIRGSLNAIQTFELMDPDGVVHSHTGQASSWTLTVAPKEGAWRGRCAGGAWAIVSVNYITPFFEEMDVTWRDRDCEPHTSTVLSGGKVLINHNPNCSTPDLVFEIRGDVNGTQTFELKDSDGVVHTQTAQASNWTFTVAPKEGAWWGRCAGGAWAVVSVNYFAPPPAFNRMSVLYCEDQPLGLLEALDVPAGGSGQILHDFRHGELRFTVENAGFGSTVFEVVDPGGTVHQQVSSSPTHEFALPPAEGTWSGRCAGGSWARVEVLRRPEPVTGLVTVALGRMTYDRRTGQCSMTATITNTSAEAVATPIWLVVTQISSPNVTVLGPDGYAPDGTPAGMPYLDLTALAPTGLLGPGQTLAITLTIAAPTRERYTMTTEVWAIPPAPK